MWRQTAAKLAINRVQLCKEAGKRKKLSTKQILALEEGASAHNYHPLPVVFEKAKGIVVQDPEGKQYFDFLSGYGAVSHGHAHPRLTKVVVDQLKKCTLSSRAFHSDVFGVYADFITKFFGYDMVLPMNTGAEGVETAMKLARKWGYKVKKIAQDQALIACATSNFHGRTFGAISLSDDESAYGNYGPKLPGIRRVQYGSASALEELFEKEGNNIAAYIVEPIQGEAGINIPPDGYLKDVRRLCTKYNVLFIADEVQSGVGRTGKMLAVDHEDVRPDVVILAKALGGGVLPVAAVLADKEIMGVFEYGTHGSTFGGNPVACALAIEALRIMVDEKLVENSAKLGGELLCALEGFKNKYPFITGVRGRGLFCAIIFDEAVLKGQAASAFMRILKDHGVLAKTTHGNIIRMSPPLVITAAQLKVGIQRIGKALDDLQKAIKAAP